MARGTSWLWFRRLSFSELNVIRQAPGSWHPRGQPTSLKSARGTAENSKGARSPVDLERRHYGQC
eukprot:837531-Prymnesium_polylepis.2